MRVFRPIRDFLQGVWESQKASLADPLVKAKMHNDDALMLVLFGDLLGFPIPPSFYSKKLLAYCLGRLTPWERRILKERDVLECMSE